MRGAKNKYQSLHPVIGRTEYPKLSGSTKQCGKISIRSASKYLIRYRKQIRTRFCNHVYIPNKPLAWRCYKCSRQLYYPAWMTSRSHPFVSLSFVDDYHMDMEFDFRNLDIRVFLLNQLNRSIDDSDT